jgi:hypothetical protein
MHPNSKQDQSPLDMVRNKFMGVPLTMLASTLQSQKDEMDKHIFPHKLKLTSPTSIEHLLLGTTIQMYDFLMAPLLHRIFSVPPQGINNMVNHP